MLRAAITLGFFGLLRVSEFTVPSERGFNPDLHLTAKDITMSKDRMVVLIKKLKTDQRDEGCQINIGQTHNKCCLHIVMQRYLDQATLSARKPLFWIPTRDRSDDQGIDVYIPHSHSGVAIVQGYTTPIASGLGQQLEQPGMVYPQKPSRTLADGGAQPKQCTPITL